MVLTWLFSFYALFQLISARTIEEKLVNHLLSNVSRFARPVTNPNKTIQATFGIEYIQLVKVNDREQLVTSNVWVRQTWNTDIFQWNPSEWNGIEEIQVESKRVWTPDIVLYNNGDSGFSGGSDKYKTNVQIKWNGKCIWNSPATFISNCDINIREFPFDKQTCILKFGSWTFNAKGINLTTDNNPLLSSQYKNSTEWKIESAKKIVNFIQYDCCIHPFIDVTFEFILLRKPLYYVFNVIAPCFLLVLAVLFGFFLPPESGERISLTITILLAVAVFLQLVSNSLPHNSDSIPMLAEFYFVVMAESTASLLTTCLVLIYHYRGLEANSAPMPKWMKRIFLHYLARLMRVKRHSLNEEEDASLAVIDNLADISKVTKTDQNLSFSSELSNVTPLNNRRTSNTINTSIIAAILKETKILTAKLKEQEKQGEIQDDWRFLARVIDRIFFWIFLVMIIVSCISILLPAYYVYN